MEEIKPGYKKTKIGWIPVEWEVVKLESILIRIIDCEHKTPPFSNDGYSYIRTANIKSGQLVTENLKYIDKENFKLWTRRKVPEPGDILFTREAPAGEILIVPKNHRLCLGQRIVLLEIKKNIYNSAFFKYFFYSPNTQQYLKKIFVGTTVPRINVSDIKVLPTLLIPLPEQRKIAAILSTWDRAIETTQALIEQLQLRKKGLMQQLLTGKTRLSGFSGEWEEKTFQSLLKEVKRGIIWDDDELYRLISVRRRSGGLFERESLFGREIKTKNLRSTYKGDFLISKMQIVHGASGLVTKEFDGMKISGSYLSLVARKEEELDIAFFNWMSKMPYFYHQTYISSYGVHIEKMTFNFKSFLKLRISFPSISEQKAIVEILNSTEQEITHHQSYLTSLQQQKKGLMQQLLTGQLRVL